MRVLSRLRAQADCAYDPTYHNKLRGRALKAIDDSPYADRHDANRPIGLTFSNPFPVGDITEGDQRTVLFAAPEEQLLATVAADLLDNREFNIGNLPFEVESVTDIYPDVGEPGSQGILETATGVCVRFDEQDRQEYGIEVDEQHRDSATFWQPEYNLESFRAAIEQNLDWKHDLYGPENRPGPAEFDAPIFDSYELIKTFAIPVTVTEGRTFTHVLSKWKLGYTVRDTHHRRHLNLALDCGIGEQNGKGFGFVNQKSLEEAA